MEYILEDLQEIQIINLFIQERNGTDVADVAKLSLKNVTLKSINRSKQE